MPELKSPDDMTPLELDEAVAREIHNAEWNEKGGYWYWPVSYVMMLPAGETFHPASDRTKLHQAVEALELATDGLYTIEVDKYLDGSRCVWVDPENVDHSDAKGNNLQIAICRAALKAVRAKQQAAETD